MGNNSTVTSSKNTVELWELTRNFHQCTTHSLMGLLREKTAWYFRESRSACLIRKNASGRVNCRKWSSRIIPQCREQLASHLSPTLWHWSNDPRRNQEWKHESPEGKGNQGSWPKGRKDMIELMILEDVENIEKYQKETKIWKDKKSGQKRHQDWWFGPEKKE
jgi:hypothetical protein